MVTLKYLYFHLYKVIRVTAQDADEGSNAVVTYDIVDGSDGKFIIEGQLCLYVVRQGKRGPPA